MCIAKGLVSIIVIITLILPQIEAQAVSPGDPAAGNYYLNYHIPSNFLQSTCIYTSL